MLEIFFIRFFCPKFASIFSSNANIEKTIKVKKQRNLLGLQRDEPCGGWLEVKIAINSSLLNNTSNLLQEVICDEGGDNVSSLGKKGSFTIVK